MTENLESSAVATGLVFIGRTDAEAETPILWPPDAKNWLVGKDPDAGKDWRQEEKGTTENELVGWHHRLHGHEFQQAPGDGEEQGNLACCSPWGYRVRHDWVTEQQQNQGQGLGDLNHLWCQMKTRCSFLSENGDQIKVEWWPEINITTTYADILTSTKPSASEKKKKRDSKPDFKG